jgi:Leucine-rich repeat (LRR) protein
MSEREIEIDSLRRLFENRDTFELACGFYENSMAYLDVPEFDNIIQNKDFVLKNIITYNEWNEAKFCFSFAKELHCENNQLTALPDSIGKLVNLKYLYCYNNQLTALPDSIGKLVNLKWLYCYSNQLTVLPDSIGKLVNLKYLYCENNQLTTLSDSIGNLPIKKLHLAPSLLEQLLNEQIIIEP